MSPLVRFRAARPGEIVFTLEATMTLAEWQKVGAALRQGHEGYPLVVAINDLVRQAESAYPPRFPMAPDEQAPGT